MSTVAHFILACTNDAAARTAVHVWGWQRLGQGAGHFVGFTNKQGETVVPVSSTNRLKGISAQSKLYLGESWLFAHGDVRGAIESHRARGGQVIEDGLQ